MTNTNGMGLGAHSPQKLDDFRGVADIVLKRAFGALDTYANWRRPYCWVDLTSGPALDPLPNGKVLEGTPIIAMDRLMERHTRYGIPFEATFFEQHAGRYQSLATVLRDRYGTDGRPPAYFDVIHANSYDYLERMAQPTALPGTLGAFVYDPTTQVDFDFLAEIAAIPHLRRYDLLVYVSATSIKRPRNLPTSYDTDRRTLIERLQTIPKRKWIVRKPSGPSEWSWFIGTNDPKFPVWTQRGFFDIATPAGRAVIEHMDMTRHERLVHAHIARMFGAVTP